MMSDVLVIVLALALAGALYAWWQARSAGDAQAAALTRLDTATAEQKRTIERLEQAALERGSVEQTNAEHQRVVEALQATISDQKRAMDALHAAISAREQTASASLAGVEESRRTVERLQGVIAEHEATVAALTAQIDSITESNVALVSTAASDEGAYKLSLALTLANAAYDALLVLDEERRVIAINTSAETLFGRQRPIGEPVSAVTSSPEIEMMVEDALTYREEFFEEQIVINRHTYRVRTQVIHRDGRQFTGLALQDISELVRLNRARRDMVANISHELRTPIANIRVIIDSLFHEQDKPRGKESRSALKAVARETDSLLWLVQELLDLSMIESGQAILRMVEMPADLLVNEAIERMSDQSETKTLRIVSDVPDNPQVLCDRDQARRVLINLIHNAIKWSPVGDTITVTARPSADDVTFAVLDNGPGVPDDQTERIFERFYQVDASRSKGEGTGLGLAICKHIVEAHGGRIWAEGNSNGRGGQFLFTLPTADETTRNGDSQEFA